MVNKTIVKLTIHSCFCASFTTIRVANVAQPVLAIVTPHRIVAKVTLKF